jgi:hypothetical protein
MQASVCKVGSSFAGTGGEHPGGQRRHRFSRLRGAPRNPIHSDSPTVVRRRCYESGCRIL